MQGRRLDWIRNGLLLFALAVVTAGCGGGNSATDLRRLSRKRKPETPQPTTPAAPAPQATAANGPPPTAPVPSAAPANASPPPATAPPAVAVVPPPPAGGPPPPITIQNAKPIRPLDESERWFRATNNLQKIGAALNAYLKHNKTLPGSRFNGGLSWRVELLPYLGYENLYRNFDLNASWDSPQNAALLKHIPPEYQSPERFDEKTNMLLATGGGCCGGKTTAEQFEDGITRTILVVESDDEFAAPWSSPGDLSFDATNARRGLGKLRPEGALVLFGDFRVLAISPIADKAHVVAFFTKNGADNAFIDDYCLLPESVNVKVTPRPAVAANSPSPNATLPATSTTPETPTPQKPTVETAAPELPPSLIAARPDDRREPPAAADRKQVAADFREIYKEDYEAAKRPEERTRLAAKLLAETTRVEQDDTAYFVLNDIVRKLAAAAGDVTSLTTAVENLDRRYRVDGIELRIEGLTQIVTTLPKNNEVSAAVGRAAEQLMHDAVERDNFNAAIKAVDLQRSVALRKQDRNAVNDAAARRQELEAAKAAFRDAVDAAKVLESNPGDTKANETLGRYLTLIKNAWDVGLPYLAKSEDVRLRFVATIDAEKDKSPANMATVGDQWWELGESLKPPFRRGAHLRATHWYAAARPQLPSGLQKVRVDQRLLQSRKLYPEFATAKTEAAPTDE